MIDTTLVRELRFLGIAEESWPVLALLPLIQVAWADGTIQPAERDLILTLARERFQLDEEGDRLIETWLAHPPSERYLVRGRSALHLLSTHFPDLAEVDNVLELAQAVAQAAGGIFGFKAVDAREKEVLKELHEALSVPPERRWDWMDDLEADGDPEADQDDTLDEHSDHQAPVVTFQAADAPRALDGAMLARIDLSPPVAIPLPASGVRIGRSRACDLWIRSDPRVSRHHALIYQQGEAWRIQDQQSTTGTWVNGERVVDRRLFGGEEIHIGEEAFRFEVETDDEG